ncbi:MAG: outer membrane protein [Rhodomicrobium sp.]
MFRMAVLGLVSAALISSAYAADLGAGGDKDGVYLPGAWTGFYVGVNGGYGWSASNSTLNAYASSAANAVSTTSPTVGYGKDGGFGGGQIGYNYQMNRFVWGLEADIQDADMKGSASATATALPVVASAYRETSLEWFGTVRGRLGYSFDHTLIYFTGGFAYGRNSASSSITLDEKDIANGIYTYSPSSSGIHTGYVLGTGLEYALTHDWSIKAEYQYFDLGNTSGYFYYHIYPGGLESAAQGNVTTEHDFHTVRLGLNYHLFQGQEPLK